MEQLSEKRKEPANQGEDAKMRKFDLDERLTPWRRNVCAVPNPKTSGVAARDVSTGQFVLSVVFWVLGPQRRSASNPLWIGYSAWIFGARAAKRTRRRSELPSRLSPFAIWALGWTDRRLVLHKPDFCGFKMNVSQIKQSSASLTETAFSPHNSSLLRAAR